MDFLNIKDKTFFIAGVANKKSVAYFSAKVCHIVPSVGIVKLPGVAPYMEY